MKPEQAEIDRLKKENAKLRMERDILKKAAVNIQIARSLRHRYPLFLTSLTASSLNSRLNCLLVPMTNLQFHFPP
jgi:hypothetical protein